MPVQSANAKGNGEADGVLLLELGGRDSTSSGLSDFLYCIEVSNGQTSEVFEVKATMSWSGSEARERSAKVTEKVSVGI